VADHIQIVSLLIAINSQLNLVSVNHSTNITLIYADNPSPLIGVTIYSTPDNLYLLGYAHTYVHTVIMYLYTLTEQAAMLR